MVLYGVLKNLQTFDNNIRTLTMIYDLFLKMGTVFDDVVNLPFYSWGAPHWRVK